MAVERLCILLAFRNVCWHVENVAELSLVEIDAFNEVVMYVLEESLLVLPDLEEELPVSVESFELYAVDLVDDNYVVVGSLPLCSHSVAIFVLLLGTRAVAALHVLFVAEDLDDLHQIASVDFLSYLIEVLL